MPIVLETERLYIRELDCSDNHDLFEMDSDPEVHLYLENKPVETMDEINQILSNLKNQYAQNGIARWAVVDKITNECIGWAGLKFYNEPMNNHIHFYELGYRFKQKHWGKGFATESSKAILEYGFQHLNVTTIFAITDPRNDNSKNVLTKLGFVFKETFDYDGEPTYWFELKKSDFQ